MSYNSVCDEETFIAACIEYKSTSKVSETTGIGVRNVIKRRNKLYHRTGVFYKLDGGSGKVKVTIPETSIRTNVELENGCIIVISDAHYSKDVESAAHKAAVLLNEKLKPEIFIMNGDAFDGSVVGSHNRIMWDHHPTVKEELDAVQDNLEEIVNVNKNAKYLFNWGNHDQRFNSKLSHRVEQFEGVKGFNFTDHFPKWKFSMSIMVNENTMIKHRWANGIHAIYNNVLRSGVNIVTGYLHSLKVTPYTDYNGTRYGVDTGCLAYPFGVQFNYTEDNPRNHRSGFAILTFRDGQLMPPELMEVVNEEEGLCWFRGRSFNV